MMGGAMAADSADARPAPPGRATTVGELYQQHHAPMVRTARLLVDSEAEAQELVQDVFVRMHQRWTTIRDPEAYLRRSVVNGCRSHLRRRIRERTHAPEPVRAVESPELDETWDALRRLSPRRR